MKTSKTLRIIEDEATAFEDSHGYDPDNQATLELAHEMRITLEDVPKTNRFLLLQSSFTSCLNSYRDALEEARADIMERIK